VRKVMYRIARENGSLVLVRTIGDLATAVPEVGQLEIVNRADVVGLRIEYKRPDGTWTGPEEGWHDLVHPTAVRVSLTLYDQRSGRQVSRKTIFPIQVN